jgi:hypothetical protein
MMPEIVAVGIAIVVLWIVLVVAYAIYIGYHFHRWETRKWHKAIAGVAFNKTNEDHVYFWITVEKLALISAGVVLLYLMS